MRESRAATSIRHLCSLGLSAEVLVPQFLDVLREVVHSDSRHFFWTDKSGIPCNYFGSLTGVEKQLLLFMEEIDRVELPADGKSISFKQMIAAKEAVLVGQGGDRHKYLASFFYNEILRGIGGQHVLLAPAWHSAEGHAGIGLWREAEGAQFVLQDKLRLQSATQYLSYALSVSAETDLPLVEDENRGIVLLEAGGRIVQMDRRAERLLFLAAYPQVDYSLRKYAGDFTHPVRELCHNLLCMFAGKASPPPQHFHRNKWGMFGFRAHWMQRPDGRAEDLVAVVVSLHVPLKLRLWQGIRTLDLSPRQQEVCLLFAEGYSLTEIAGRIDISRHTAIDHVRKIYERLDMVPDRDALRERLLKGS